MNKEDLIMHSGRLVNTINIDSLAELYKRNVLNIISKMKFKTVAFDFDGTLTEFKYAENTLLPCTEEGLYEYSKTGNIYENVHMTVLKTK